LVKFLYTTKQEPILVDDDVYEKFRFESWFITKGRNGSTGYAAKSEWIKGANKSARVYLHRIIMDPAKGIPIDHINGNKLDNRRENLRVVNASVNEQNKKPYGESRLKGVHFNKHAGKWQSKITKDKKQIHLGYFDSSEDAARMYNFWALDLYGENAYFNKEIHFKEDN
jgi:hypothetical protein